MTVEELLDFYPRVRTLPPSVLEHYTSMANARFEFLGADAEEARRLFAAHCLTMYRRASETEDPRLPLTKKVGNVSISYKAEDMKGSGLALTVFGRQLRMLLRCTTTYVP